MLTRHQVKAKREAEAQLARYNRMMAQAKAVYERLQAMQASELPAQARDVDGLRARLIAGHGRDDDLIPYTESLLLAEHVPPGTPFHLEILDSFHHVDITLGEGEGIADLLGSVAEVRRLFSLIYDLLAQGLL